MFQESRLGCPALIKLWYISIFIILLKAEMDDFDRMTVVNLLVLFIQVSTNSYYINNITDFVNLMSNRVFGCVFYSNDESIDTGTHWIAD